MTSDSVHRDSAYEHTFLSSSSKCNTMLCGEVWLRVKQGCSLPAPETLRICVLDRPSAWP